MLAYANSELLGPKPNMRKGGELCTRLATRSHKKDYATETKANEQHAGLKTEASQETGRRTDDSQTRQSTDISMTWTSSNQKQH